MYDVDFSKHRFYKTILMKFDKHNFMHPTSSNSIPYLVNVEG